MAFTTIYIILTVIAVFLIRIIWLARQNQAYAFFSVHREDARRDLIGASIILVMVLGLMAATFYIQQVLSAPPEPPPSATPAPEIAANTPTPLPSPTARPTLPPTASPTPQPTATAIVTATSTAPPPPPPPSPPPPLPSPTQNPALGQPPQCANSGSAISTPGNGARVNGMVQITGTAFIDNFDYYKFELRLPNGEWAYLSHSPQAVNQGVLGAWNSDTVPPGEYEFRLVVVDTSGNYPEPCVVRLVVE